MRYHAMHAIFEKLLREKNKNSATSPLILIYIYIYTFYEKKNIITKTCFMVKHQNLNPACVVRSNMSSERVIQNYKDIKAAVRRAVSVIPIKYLQKCFLKTTREYMGIKKIWFLKMQSM
jgi:hypothetical protein